MYDIEQDPEKYAEKSSRLAAFLRD